MDKKLTFRIIAIATIIVVLGIVITVVPLFLKYISPPYSLYYLFWYLTVGYICIFLNILVVVIGLILFIIYVIKSRKFIKIKKTLFLIDMIFGSNIIVISIIGIGFLFHGFLEEWILLGWIINVYSSLMIPLLLLAIPGIFMLIHGRHLHKILRSENI